MRWQPVALYPRSRKKGTPELIAYLTGTVLRMPEASGQMVLLTADGVGYEVTLPAFVLQSLIADGITDGDPISLEVYYHTTDRQPKPVLVGFRHAHEKRFFEQLIQVEGVGPARAAAALIFPVSGIARAIESEDMTVLRRMPGIGERGAQKIIAALRGKVTEWAMMEEDAPGAESEPAVDVTVSKTRDQAIEVLVNLGHRAVNARDNVDQALARRPELSEDSEELIREVFRSLAGTTT